MSLAPLPWSDQVPARLRARVGEALAGAVSPTPEEVIERAVALTRPILQDAAGGRGTALDLLAADAMVTHALHQLADNPERFEDGCAVAMTALSSMVPTGD